VKSKIVLLYDCDTNKSEEDYMSLLYIRKMTNNQANQLFKIGIENLLILPENFDSNPFYSISNKMDKYSAESTIRELDKSKLCSYICEVIDCEQQKTIFKNIHSEIETILQLIDKK
jgi:hypothetical protein